MYTSRMDPMVTKAYIYIYTIRAHLEGMVYLHTFVVTYVFAQKILPYRILGLVYLLTS